ncbi:MAG: hypothetical protein RLZZ01_272 [Actinomycetota bacterium]
MIHPLSEARFTAPRPDCPHPERWHSDDSDATEHEVSEFVHGLVRALQPDTCLETGTHLGHTARAIGAALLANGQGTLHTFEPNLEKVKAARVECEGLPVTVHPVESMTSWVDGPIDFAWFDSLLHLRVKEFEYYLPWMHSRTVVGFHDAGPHHGPWSHAAREHPRLRAFDLPTPRGCLIGRVI